MVSTEQKRQAEQRRVQRIIAWALGISLLFHGALLAVARQFPAPEFAAERTFEVALSPQQRPTPQPTPQPAPKKAPRRTIQVKPRLQQAKRLRQITRIQKPRRQRSINQRVATLPRRNQSNQKSNPAPTMPNISAPSAPRFSSLPSRTDRNNAPNRNFNPTRPAGRNFSPTTRSPRENEIAKLPEGDGFTPSTSGRTGRKRGADTQLYLPGESAPDGNASNSSNNELSALRPGFNNRGTMRPDNSGEAPGNSRLPKRFENGGISATLRPQAAYPSRNDNEEAAENAPTANDGQSRRTRTTRRNNRSAEESLYPTPTPEPKSSQPASKPERETYRRSRVFSPTPDYPEDARAAKKAGVVVVRVHVDEQGKITSVEIVSSSGVPSLDANAVRAAKRGKYEPAKRGDKTITSSFKLTYRYNLTD